MKKILGVTLLLGFLLWMPAVSIAYDIVHAKQNGYLQYWPTINGKKITPIPVWNEVIEKCDWYPSGMVWDDWFHITDVWLEFKCDETCGTTTSHFYAPHYDANQGEWQMYTQADWRTLGIGPGSNRYFPGMTNDTQNLYVAIDMLSWVEGNGSYNITGSPEELYYYTFSNGISDDLPGVYVSNSPLTWNPSANHNDPHHGWSSYDSNGISDWFEGDSYVCHETSTVPEPATVLLFSSGLIGLAGFRRKLRK
jgi:hypothetical protein